MLARLGYLVPVVLAAMLLPQPASSAPAKKATKSRPATAAKRPAAAKRLPPAPPAPVYLPPASFTGPLAAVQQWYGIMTSNTENSYALSFDVRNDDGKLTGSVAYQPFSGAASGNWPL